MSTAMTVAFRPQVPDFSRGTESLLLTALLLFIGTNAYSLVCWPLDEPFSRPDILSLSERTLDAWRSKQVAEDLSPLINQISLTDTIRSCMQNETLYHMFSMDKKFHLYELRGYGRELYDRLAQNVQTAFSDVNISRPIAAFASPAQLLLLQRFFNFTVESNIQQIFSQIKNGLERLDKVSKVVSFTEELNDGGKLPRVVEIIAKQLHAIQVNSSLRCCRPVLRASSSYKGRNDSAKMH
ncbi:unnamed protein product [Gongylonema pulchrum]|uniref:Conserved oligomeric Golgi complex subunit 7 n=1 Tax=Gongylonema pulchrum TaxID=637853 RepID=A0A183ED05_9BILA|nr:unnamed protein product [Gongylonema pulchrum]